RIKAGQRLSGQLGISGWPVSHNRHARQKRFVSYVAVPSDDKPSAGQGFRERPCMRFNPWQMDATARVWPIYSLWVLADSLTQPRHIVLNAHAVGRILRHLTANQHVAVWVAALSSDLNAKNIKPISWTSEWRDGIQAFESDLKMSALVLTLNVHPGHIAPVHDHDRHASCAVCITHPPSSTHAVGDDEIEVLNLAPVILGCARGSHAAHRRKPLTEGRDDRMTAARIDADAHDL